MPHIQFFSYINQENLCHVLRRYFQLVTQILDSTMIFAFISTLSKLVPQYKRFWNPGGSIVHTGTYRHSEISHVTDRDNDDSHSITLTHSLSLSQTIFKPRTDTHTHTHTHTHTQAATQTYTMSCRRHAVQYNRANISSLRE